MGVSGDNKIASIGRVEEGEREREHTHKSAQCILMEAPSRYVRVGFHGESKNEMCSVFCITQLSHTITAFCIMHPLPEERGMNFFFLPLT